MGGYASREASPTPSPRRSRLGARPPFDAPRPRIDESHFRELGLWAAHPHDVVNPVAYRSPLQRSGIVQNVVNLDKGSLAVHPSPDDPRVLCLQFDFSASVPGYISVYFCAKQVLHRAVGAPPDTPVKRVSYSALAGKSEKAPVKAEKTKFGPGVALRYRQKAARGLRLDDFEEMRLMAVVDDHYPIVIRIEAKHGRESTIAKDSRVTSQSTFAALVKKDDGGWGIKLIRQEVLVAGTIYVIQELYGIGAVDVTASKTADSNSPSDNVYSIDASNECVICLIEPCNTAVLPCNHLCLCQDCGAKLSTDPSLDRRRCPICRTDLESLLRIIPTTLPKDKDKTEVDAIDIEAVGGTTDGATAAVEGEEGDIMDPEPKGSLHGGDSAVEGSTATKRSAEGQDVIVAGGVMAGEALKEAEEEEASLSSDMSEETMRDEDGAVTRLSPPTDMDVGPLGTPSSRKRLRGASPSTYPT